MIAQRLIFFASRLCCAVGLVCGAAAYGQISAVPAEMNFQGTLYQTDGKTPTAGPVDLEVRVYANKGDDLSTALWGERHDGVPLFGGIFNVRLGEGDVLGALNHGPLAAIFTQNGLWVGFTVVGEAEERGERQQLVSAPFALTANTAMTAVHGTPPGTIAVWCGSGDVPEGWLACNGGSVLRTADPNAPNTPAYPELFAAIGTTWGAGASPGATFSLPNFGGRALVGENVSSPGTDANTAGQTPANAGLRAMNLGALLGAETHTLSIAELPAHTHSNFDSYATGTDNESAGAISPAPYANSNNFTRTTDSAGGGEAHPNMQPSIVMQFIIKY